MFDKDKKYPEIIQQKIIAESFKVSSLDLHFTSIGTLTLHRAAI
jgi:hypothetical protein